MNSIEWLAQLIAFDTTSRNSNLKMVTTIKDWLSAQHIESRLTYDVTGKKANLFATLPAQNGFLKDGLILSGHTDVVPVDGQQWDTDPFCATQVNERIYGRGTCDMKGFIAVVLALIPEFRQLKLAKPLHLAWTYDEEIGCLGAPALIKDFQQQGIQPAACIVGEPTEGRPVVAHKGIQIFRCRVYGRATHSSLTPQGCNAIEYAAQLISWIRERANQLKDQGPFDLDFDVPFTSMTTNLISGGTANNIIPSFCEFFFEFRHLPQMDPNSIVNEIKSYINEVFLPNMRNEYANANIEFDALGSVPAFAATEDASITQIARSINNETKIRKVSYATEAGLFQRVGIPTILCGPGSIDQAHGPNEFVSLEQIQQCEGFLRQLIRCF